MTSRSSPEFVPALAYSAALLVVFIAPPITISAQSVGGVRDCDAAAIKRGCEEIFVKEPGTIKVHYRRDVETEVVSMLEGFGFSDRNQALDYSAKGWNRLTYALDRRGASLAVSAYDDGEGYVVLDVPAGYEKLWLAILRRTGKFTAATRPKLLLAMIDREIALNLGIRDPQPFTTKEVDATSSQAMERVLKWMETRYAKKGKVVLRKSAPRRLHVQVEGLRKEVLPKKDLWEMIEVHVIHADSSPLQTLYIVLETMSAPGFGGTVPAAANFVPTQFNYPAETALYADQFALEIKRAAETP